MQSRRLRFSFTGSGAEYFRIWIVNLLLTVVTLGIYSAWAKVRRTQYCYRNTWVNATNFDYHGTPGAILKGRIVAVALFGGYNVAIKLAPIVGVVIVALIAVVMPWLLLKSFRFRAVNSSHAGLRFGFAGSIAEAYKAFLLWPVLGLVTLYLLAPLAHRRIKAFQHDNARFGTTPFSFHATTGAFYKLYGITLLLYLLGFFAFGAVAGFAFAAVGPDKTQFVGIAVLLLIPALIALQAIGAYFVARLQNLVWNNTHLAGHVFESRLRARGLFWMKFTNLLGIVFTGGLYKPFADVRLLRYRLDHVELLVDGDPAAFVADARQRVGATGEEMAEMFDLDFAL